MNILITGAGRGIGNALVRELASRGGHKLIALSRNSARINKLAEETNTIFPSSQVYAYEMDLEGTNQDYSGLFDFIKNTFGNLDVLVNNAGFLTNKPYEILSAEEEIKTWKVNYLAPSMLIRLLLPVIGLKERGHVVNISSMGGVQGSQKFPGLSSYSASKSALATLTECLAEEFKSRNMAFNCIALGAVQTEMLEEAFPGYRADLSPEDLSVHLADFCLKGMQYCNGKILPWSLSLP